MNLNSEVLIVGEEMGHNDLMGQAEDVADQVSTAPLETATLPRVE